MVVWMLLACGPKTPSSPLEADPFPMVEGARWSYDATFNGRQMSETRVATRIATASGDAFAFIEEDEQGDDVISTFTGMFGLGAYRREGAVIVTADATWASDFSELEDDDFQPLLRLPLQAGDRAQLQTRSPDRAAAITVEAVETISVPAGTFSCTRLHLGGESYAWLAEGVGLVKWVYVTGREEVLTDYSLTP